MHSAMRFRLCSNLFHARSPRFHNKRRRECKQRKTDESPVNLCNDAHRTSFPSFAEKVSFPITDLSAVLLRREANDQSPVYSILYCRAIKPPDSVSLFLMEHCEESWEAIGTSASHHEENGEDESFHAEGLSGSSLVSENLLNIDFNQLKPPMIGSAGPMK